MALAAIFAAFHGALIAKAVPVDLSLSVRSVTRTWGALFLFRKGS